MLTVWLAIVGLQKSLVYSSSLLSHHLLYPWSDSTWCFETNYEDMVGIMDHLHTYVPTVIKEYSYKDPETAEEVKVPVEHFHQVLVGMS